MKIALLHSHFEQEHLEEVKAEMGKLGSPQIKAVWMECYGLWAALEGCHRIRAAMELEIPVSINAIDYDEISNLDVTDKSLGLDIDMTGTTFADLLSDMRDCEIVEVSE